MTEFSVTILGAGSATPAIDRHPTSQLITHNNETFLIDCGEGTQYRLLELKLRPSRLKAIFISHLHGDHYYGLVPLLSSLNMGGRTEKLYLFGPKGLKEIIDLQIGIAGFPFGFPLIFRETDTTKHYQLFENNRFTVHTIPLNHRVPCAGFLFREKPHKFSILKDQLPENIAIADIKRLKEGQDVIDESGNVVFEAKKYTNPPRKSRSYAYCSDTVYDTSFAPIIKDVDLLYHEATFSEANAEQAQSRYHSTAKQAAQIAAAANVNKLLIGHFSSRYKNFNILLEEASSVFPNTEVAVEGSTIVVSSDEL